MIAAGHPQISLHYHRMYMNIPTGKYLRMFSSPQVVYWELCHGWIYNAVDICMVYSLQLFGKAHKFDSVCSAFTEKHNSDQIFFFFLKSGIGQGENVHIPRGSVSSLAAILLAQCSLSRLRLGWIAVTDWVYGGWSSIVVSKILSDFLVTGALPPPPLSLRIPISQLHRGCPNVRPLSRGHCGCPSHVEVARHAERCMLQGVITSLQLPPSTFFAALRPTNQIFHVSWHAPSTHK